MLRICQNAAVCKNVAVLWKCLQDLGREVVGQQCLGRVCCKGLKEKEIADGDILRIPWGGLC